MLGVRNLIYPDTDLLRGILELLEHLIDVENYGAFLSNIVIMAALSGFEVPELVRSLVRADNKILKERLACELLADIQEIVQEYCWEIDGYPDDEDE